jgi:NAD(P)-dependent dehydrogenase (short-subunit alcohol dehydrogenase family)
MRTQRAIKDQAAISLSVGIALDIGPHSPRIQGRSAYTIRLLNRHSDPVHRVNRSVLPFLRKQASGLLLWNSSSSVVGGTLPYLGPYFAAKAGMDALAVAYSRELTRWGIETSIVVPGAFTKGTNHFANAGEPGDKERAAEYQRGPYKDFGETVKTAFASIVPEDADVSRVAEAMLKIVQTPAGKRPYRVVVDFTDDGSEVVNPVVDRVRVEMLRRVGLADLLTIPKARNAGVQ